MNIEFLIDVVVHDHGTVVEFKRVSPEGFAWIKENVQWEGWQERGDSLFVDHRPAQTLFDAMVDARLRVGPPGMAIVGSKMIDA